MNCEHKYVNDEGYDPIIKSHKSICDKTLYMDCPPGWVDLIDDLLYRLEALNILYGRKYGLAIRVIGAKEKYGTLRFDYGIIMKDLWICKILSWPFMVLLYKAFKVKNYDCTKKHPFGRFRSFLNGVAINIRGFSFHGKRWHHERAVIMNEMIMHADKLVADAEKESYNVCAECGRQIGTEYSPRMTTKGWIKHYCKQCYPEKKFDKDEFEDAIKNCHGWDGYED